jgi:hypothetical protein
LPALICSMDAGISSNAISTNGRASDAKTPDYPEYGTVSA